jgi:hypothetical protein
MAVRTHDRLHANDKPFINRLIRILQSKLRTDFSGTECEAKRENSVDDFSPSSTLLENEVRD